MNWFRRNKIQVPEERTGGIERSLDALKESERKLNEARKAQLEVDKIAKKSRELSSRGEQFSEALLRAMRRHND